MRHKLDYDKAIITDPRLCADVDMTLTPPTIEVLGRAFLQTWDFPSDAVRRSPEYQAEVRRLMREMTICKPRREVI